MAYQSLARKYRPQNFHELVGQEGVALALANGIRIGREPHAAIFSGVRGVGKTTLARLYAKALNCEKGPTHEPCGECVSCQSITSGNHEDVLEIDGASNTGVDDVRALRETIDYVPQRSKYKVYIIDEVHMLSQSAFNALLKTLEEPPAHVIFLFATTEIQKIPETIVSRCQQFVLKKFSVAAIKARLEQILIQEDIPFEDKALYMVAKEGQGSMRDALTFLDQAIAVGEGKLSLEGISSILVFVSVGIYLDLLGALVAKDQSKVIEICGSLDGRGIDFITVCEHLAKLARHGFVIKDVGERSLDLAVLGIEDGEMKRLTEIAQQAQPFDLNRIFRTLVKCRTDLEDSDLDRFVFENYLLEWCLDPGFPKIHEMMTGGKVPQNTRQPLVGATKKAPAPAPPAPQPITQQTLVTPPPKPLEVSFPKTWKDFVDAWKTKKPLRARILEEVYVLEYSLSKIALAVKEGSMAGHKLLEIDLQKRLIGEFRDLFGFEGIFEVTKASDEEMKQDTLLDEKERNKESKRAAIIEEAKNAPMTKSVMQAFDATIDQVHVDL